ncbi:MAG: transcription elongation factor GreA [Ruminococcus sp.]|nr:transcription elongation factor GreA [Ruminococcus sp.]
MANTISKAGFQRLKEQLEYLKNVRRGEVAENLKIARSYGDLSENAEYDEAKNEQAILEGQIAEMEQILATAIVVDDDDISVDEVGIGSILKLRNLEMDEVEQLQVVGSTESDPDNMRISDESPIGKAALGKKVGDVFEVEVPDGLIKFEVLEISK